RWFETVGAILEEQRELEERDEGQPVSRRLRHQGASLIRSHPVAIASLLGVVVFGFAFRTFIGPDRLQGGAVALFPSAPHDFFAGAILAAGVVLASQVLGGRSRVRGSARSLQGAAVGSLLVFPMLPSLAAGGARALGSGIGGTAMSPIARLALGAGPGTGLTA